MNEQILRKMSNISTEPGVYIMKDSSGTVIYVGKARNLKNRVNTYFNNSKKLIKVQAMVNSVYDFDYIICKTEYDALALENNLIKKYQPYYNILLKDGKTFPYIKVKNVNYPYLEITRKIEKDGSKYFGPFIGKYKAKDILSILNSAFNLRECTLDLSRKRTKTCIRNHLGMCFGVCIHAISEEQYRKQLDMAIQYLNGDENILIDTLKRKMHKMIEEQNYEKAIIYRDNITFLENMHLQVITELNKKDNADIFAYSNNGQNVSIAVGIVRNGKLLGMENKIFEKISETFFEDYIVEYYNNNVAPKEVILGEELSQDVYTYIQFNQNQNINFLLPQRGIKKQLLRMVQKNAEQCFIKAMNKKELEYNRTMGAVFNLQKILDLPKPPMRMECYDISHISGIFKVASMVVFTEGKPNKAHYRKFKIKEVQGNNDFESLKETLKRRLIELNSEEKVDISFKSVPDLLIIDGGKGQLSSVMQIFEQYAGKYKNQISVISLAKREEEIFVPYKSEPVIIAKNKMELQLIQRIRDEAHRFAITFHRSLRGKGMIKSFLDDIVGIGRVKKKAILNHFKSFEQIQESSVQDFMRVEGINQKLAQAIYDKVHSDY